jgi:hypothetical protein
VKTTGRLWTRVVPLAALLLAAAPAGAAADVSFKRRGTEEKRFVAAVGEAIVKAAHPSAKKIGLVKYEYTRPKPNRTDLAIKMEFYGQVTKKRYVADIVVKIDSTDKDAWEVLNIEYSDNDSVPYSAKKVQELIKQLNK